MKEKPKTNTEKFEKKNAQRTHTCFVCSASSESHSSIYLLGIDVILSLFRSVSARWPTLLLCVCV